jgi:hypothetical protein
MRAVLHVQSVEFELPATRNPMQASAEIPHYRILQAIAVLKGDAVAAYPNCPYDWTLEPQSLPREYQHRETIAALKKLADHAEMKNGRR